MGRKHTALAFIILCIVFGNLSAQSLAEKLGYSKEDKLLIININDAGMCHATNEAAESALKLGTASSASILIPSPWVFEIASFANRNPQYTFGIQLTLTNERTRNYAWGSVASADKVSSILDKRGVMYSELDDLFKNASLEEVELELRAQILKAYLIGLTPYFLNSHWGALSYDEAYWQIFCKIAADYNLPVRFNSKENYHGNDISNRSKTLDSLHIVYPDHLVWNALDNVRSPQEVAGALNTVIDSLQPGVTELFLAPAELSPELKNITHDYMYRAQELAWLQSEETKQMLADKGIKLISYKALWELQHKK